MASRAHVADYCGAICGVLTRILSLCTIIVSLMLTPAIHTVLIVVVVVRRAAVVTQIPTVISMNFVVRVILSPLLIDVFNYMQDKEQLITIVLYSIANNLIKD